MLNKGHFIKESVLKKSFFDITKTDSEYLKYYKHSKRLINEFLKTTAG